MSGEDTVAVPMPLYRSHKEVRALQIKEVDVEKAILHFVAPFLSRAVTLDYMKKHNPQAGGYFVMYDDDYQSWSPKAPFEAGYTRI